MKEIWELLKNLFGFPVIIFGAVIRFCWPEIIIGAILAIFEAYWLIWIVAIGCVWYRTKKLDQGPFPVFNFLAIVLGYFAVYYLLD